MLASLKLLQSLVRTLHSEGTPAQIAAGVALGAALGLTPLVNVHNLLVLALLAVMNVSFGAGLLGWALFVPLGFALDPLFDRIGRALLEAPALAPTWTTWYNAPGIPYTNFNNTVVLGSMVAWLALSPAIFALAWLTVRGYRTRLAPRVERWRVVQAVKASKAYDVYRWFVPE